MAEIRWTEEAERWLRDIHEYIAADNPGAAARTVQGHYRIACLVREDRSIDVLGVFHGALDITKYQL